MPSSISSSSSTNASTSSYPPAAAPLVNPWATAAAKEQSASTMTASTSASSMSSSQRPSIYHRTTEPSLPSSSSTSSLATTSSSSSSKSRLSTSSSTSTLVDVASNHSRKTLSPLRSLPSQHKSKRSTPSFRLTVPKSAGVPEPLVQPKPVIFEEEYQEEVTAYMYALEATSLPNVDLMNSQPELRWFMRPYLVDFLIEIQQTFRLKAETLYLAMNIVDRYVSKRIVFKRHYQLVGSAALLIAAKYEDVKDRVPTVYDLSCMCCQAYDENAFIQMEGHILQTLQWSIGHPTAEAWLRLRFMQTPGSTKTQNVARFLLETTLFHRDFVGVPSSVLASAAFMLARYICQEEPSATKPTPEVTSIAQLIDYHVGQHLSELSTILLKKYSYQHFSSASSLVRSFYLQAAAQQKKAQEEKKAEAASSSAAAIAAAASVPVKGAAVSMMQPEDADISMDSVDSSPSSAMSTPARVMKRRSNFRDGDDDDDDEDDDDTDMPITPLHDQSTYSSVPMSMSMHSNGNDTPSPCDHRRRTSKGQKEHTAAATATANAQRRQSMQKRLSVRNIPAIVVNQ